MADTIPAINSTWARQADDATATVTGVTTMHGRTKIAYTLSYPDSNQQGVGMSDLDHFTTRYTESTR